MEELFSFFPRIYPEENFHYFIARYHYYSGSTAITQTISETLGPQKKTCCVEFPSGLEFFASKYEFYSSDYFIYKHTLLPLFLPFLTFKRQEEVVFLVKNSGLGIYRKLGFESVNGIKRKSGLAYCPKCLEENLGSYNEAYFHRLHQMPGILVCPNHACYLHEVQIKEERKNHQTLLKIKSEKINFSSLYETDSKIAFYLQLVSKTAMEIINQKSNLDISRITSNYLEFLKVRGFVKPCGQIRQKELIKEFAEFYGPSFFDKINFSLKEIEKWFRKISQPAIFSHPIKHILLIIFLADSWQSFINLKKPTLNMLVSKDKQFKDGMRQVRHHKGRDNLTKIMYRKDKSWDLRLTNLIVKEQVTSVTKIAQIMDCNYYTVISHALKLGLRDKIKSSRHELKKQRIHDDRAVIHKFISDNPGTNRITIKRHLSAEVAYLYKYDKEWLNNILPPPRFSLDVEINYKEVDNTYNELILKVYNDLINSTKPIRITRNLLLKRIPQKLDIRQLDNLPLTSNLLDKITESWEQFLVRKIDLAVKKLSMDVSHVTKIMIMNNANIKMKFITPELENYLTNCLKKLNSKKHAIREITKKHD